MKGDECNITRTITLYLFTKTIHEDNMNSNQKRQKTLMLTHGVDNVSKIPEVQERRRKTFAANRSELLYDHAEITEKIDGKSLRIFRLNKDIADDWLKKYHPLQAPRGNLLSLGLVDDDTIYCIMTFKKSRNKQYNVELSRMWTLPGYEVIQGYDILSQYASEFGLYNIVSYVNITFENVKNYEMIGMHCIRNIQSTKWWVNSERRISDASRRQFKISEDELLADGWLPVYDGGQAVYVFD